MKPASFIFLSFIATACLANAPAYGDNGRVSITEENDYFVSHDDRYYTQGLRFGYLSSSVTPGGFWDKPYSWLGSAFPIFADGGKRKYDWTVVGQSIFTPADTALSVPSPKDRPYAGWLYTGASLLQETPYDNYHTLENFELLAGVVGPGAYGGITQNDFHQFINDKPARGWSHQLHNEPGFVVTYERKWRFEQPLLGSLAVDVSPEAGASGGNVLTYGEAGALVRIGQNLAADYGPRLIRPSLSGTGWFDADQLDGNFGWYIFAGAQGRAVGHNIFLDGNSFVSGPSVEKKPLVADFVGGASLFWSDDARLDFTYVQRTKEFYGQSGHPDRFGSINLAVLFW